jgi:hypothetical protein
MAITRESAREMSDVALAFMLNRRLDAKTRRVVIEALVARRERSYEARHPLGPPQCPHYTTDQGCPLHGETCIAVSSALGAA